MNLLESYKGRLAVCEQYYAQSNGGAKLDNTKKMIVAQCLDNTAKYINEAFNSAAGTQRSDLGAYKKFCMDITVLTVPNMIVNDLFIVKPMPSFSGYITYMQFGLGEEKGGVGGLDSEGNLNTVTQDPFVWAPITEDRARYSGEKVVESFAAAPTKVSWTPCIVGDVKAFDANGDEVTGITVAADGTLAGTSLANVRKVAYAYDNQIVPQDKLPTLVGKMKMKELIAKARRIAIQYSQFAAYQAKQDYGMDFESTIAQQAQAELQYETDSEAVFLIKNAADNACTAAKGNLVTWVDEELDTISYAMKAEGFARKLEQVKAGVFKRTGRYMPNWMLVSPDMMPILTFVPGFTAASSAIANGPYVAGNIAGMKVIVHPALGAKVCYLGVLGNDGKTAVGVYAPYMPLVPTQLLGFADGTMSQGFSSMYAMEILNSELLGKIVVEDGDGAALVKNIATSEI